MMQRDTSAKGGRSAATKSRSGPMYPAVDRSGEAAVTEARSSPASPLRPRLAIIGCAGLVLLAVPTALAFFAGGYFDAAQQWAGLIVWALVLMAAVAGAAPLPRDRSALLALIGLGLLAAWTLISTIWAPIAGNAYHAGQRLVLYAGTLLGATALLRGRGAQRAVEPVLAAGTLIVIGYGISERLLPGLLQFQHSVSAEGRLEQPLTYWNAMGELAALGIVLAVRVAGDATRARWLRIAAAAATAPLGLGLYLTFSRGALFACAAGLLTLFVAGPTRAQLRALLICLCSGTLAATAAAPFSGVTSLIGSRSTGEQQGAITLVLLAVIVVATARVQSRLIRTEPPGALQLPRRTPLITLGLVCLGLGAAIVAGARESSRRPLAPGATRLVTLESNRYDYWRVALRVFGQEPIRGVGAEGWSVSWLRLRPIDVSAQDAHSLPLQTAAELGIVGLAALGLFFWGVAAAARTAHRSAPVLAVGPLAGFVAYAAHSPLDWDWQVPALTLVALVLAGLLLAIADDVGRSLPQPPNSRA